MSSMFDFLKIFDTFGVRLTPKVTAESQFYKSKLGGFISITIYAISLGYTIWCFFLWFNNQIAPKMIESRYVTDYSHLKKDYEILTAYFFRTDVNPFQAQNNIIIPVLGLNNPNVGITYKSIIDRVRVNFSQTPAISIDISDSINYMTPAGVPNDGFYKSIAFIKCEPQYLDINQTCASEQEQTNFFASANNLIEISLRQILLDDQHSPQESVKKSYFFIEPTLLYIMNVDLKVNQYQVTKNLIFSRPQIQEFFSGYTINGQTNTKEFAILSNEQRQPYGLIYAAVQSQQNRILITYPGVGELLAQIGSIISVLFIIKYIIYTVNESHLWDEIRKQVISFYYPAFKHIEFEYTWFRKIKSVKFKGNQIDKSKFMDMYQQLTNKVVHKMTFTNLIYEISRLYLILRSNKSQSEIARCHLIGINMDQQFQYSLSSDREPFDDLTSRFILNDDDFNLISSDYKVNPVLSEHNNNQQKVNFYSINRSQMI